MFRTGVSTTAPEGLRWTSIPVPAGCEVKQISVGPTGLVWAILWNGRALVRAGVTRESLTGITVKIYVLVCLQIYCTEVIKLLLIMTLFFFIHDVGHSLFQPLKVTSFMIL